MMNIKALAERLMIFALIYDGFHDEDALTLPTYEGLREAYRWLLRGISGSLHESTRLQVQREFCEIFHNYVVGQR